MSPFRNGRRPPPPELLVDALQDRIHHDTGKCRPAKSVKVAATEPKPESAASIHKRLGFAPLSREEQERNLETNLDSLIVPADRHDP